MSTNIIVTPKSSGFNYDQRTIPSSPIRGDTWRERSIDNDIVKEWFWNNTYWIEINSKYLWIGSAYNAFSSPLPNEYNNIYLEKWWYVFVSANTVNNDASNYSIVTLRLEDNSGNEQIIATLTNPDSFALTNNRKNVNINTIYSTQQYTNVLARFATVGSPGDHNSATSGLLQWKYIR